MEAVHKEGLIQDRKKSGRSRAVAAGDAGRLSSAPIFEKHRHPPQSKWIYTTHDRIPDLPAVPSSAQLGPFCPNPPAVAPS